MKTKPIKYKIKLIADRFTAECTLTTDTETTDLFKNDAYSVYGKPVTVTIAYIDNDHEIHKDIFCYYLCLNPQTVTFSDKRNSKQTITFTMPARNSIIYIKSDAVYILTVEIDRRQELDENDKLLYEQKFIKRPVLLRNIDDATEERLQSFPYQNQVKRNTLFDLYVEFDTLYQHLDKTSVHSQAPEATIEAAGDFEGYFGLALSKIKPLQRLPNNNVITSKNKEWFQHIRFRIPANNIIIHLKWEERLFKIEYDIQAAFFISTSIKDSNRLIDLYEPINEKMTSMRQSTFPRYTYSVVSNDTTGKNPYYSNGNMSRQNTIEISSKLKQYMKLKDSKSTFRIGFQKKIPFTNIVNTGWYYNNIFKVDWNDPTLTIPFNMPKDDVKITLNIGMEVGQYIGPITDHVNGEFFLDAGTYNIEIRGASGGHAPTAGDGRAGARWSGTLTFNESFTLTYMLGELGKRGGDASGFAATGGGGGGGSSILMFDILPENYQFDAIYCWGGWGRGGRPNNTGVPNNSSPGRAGQGGGHDDTGNGGRGGDGGTAGPGTPGAGGIGGEGYHKDNIKNKSDIEITTANNGTYGYGNSNGYLFIFYLAEYTN